MLPIDFADQIRSQNYAKHRRTKHGCFDSCAQLSTLTPFLLKWGKYNWLQGFVIRCYATRWRIIELALIDDWRQD